MDIKDKASDFKHIENIPFTPISAVWKEDDPKHFALMSVNTVFTPFELESYSEVWNSSFLVGAGGKVGIVVCYDQGPIYIKPEYDEISLAGPGEDYEFTKDGIKGSVTMDGRFISDKEYKGLSDEDKDELIGNFISAPGI